MTRLSVSWLNPFKDTFTAMKITNLWSGVVERIKGSKSRRKLTDPLKDMPLIPSHKPKATPGFSVVLINERRGPTQYDLTGKKFRLGVVGTVIIVFLAVFGVYSALKGLFGFGYIMADGYTKGIVDLAVMPSQSQDSTGAADRQSQAYSSSAGSGAATQQSGSLGDSDSSADSDTSHQDSQSDNAGALVQSSEKLEGALSASLGKSQQTHTTQSSSASASLNTGAAGVSTGRQSAMPTQDLSNGRIINFNAQDVTVKPTNVNSGTLSFRLIKDHSDILFSGYLFVFVEMRDKRGETKIYVYPDKTHLGEGDLPSNFREGENISFKYNSRVELPYGDIRAGAGLARVSILLYGDDGKIVFQRGFEKKELLVAGPTGQQHTDGAKPKPTEKRRAL
ncbi:MAG: hypothetical protein WC647_14330 [Desulfomonilaceae bacterium]